MIFDNAMFSNADKLNAGWTEIMGWNEPDLHSSTGVSVPVDPIVAAGQWKTMYDSLKHANPSAKLWSPAVAGDKDWLHRFFGAICPNGLDGCRYAPDYLAIHVYGLTLKSFQDQVNAYHVEFGLPIAVTEYACFSWETKTTPPDNQVSAFMTQTRQWMDSTDWIVKYAWFGAARNPDWLYDVAITNKLMDAGGQLTTLGKQWRSGQ
ncbi:hypothetical protein BD324DRAFT_127383 [Kockovaella imperatae]|uniref:Asl1-like glycosyl hydrolase catalytic domain-containing protein n=1 Tax=Kockovaella imperatae TaxID=4999 RepID=A0A1Y1U9J2_9TREE|nr:hypothetical protein BD324DRAFT_127383 [Kockovaella imperatae]ORX34700.1 hypothetical protein BD324DRAFT_127383 [Kockovaella imperatae]